jgi:hypothetical protein
MEGVGPDLDVVGLLSDGLGQVLVDGDAARLERLRGNLLLLVAHQMRHKGEQVHGCLLGAHVVNADLGLGHTTAVARLDVRLVLLVAVTARRTATHDEKLFVSAVFDD